MKTPTAKKSSQSKASDPNHEKLSPEEWDFTDCPDEQVEHCAYYEYARESKKIIDHVATYRVSGDWNCGLYPGDAEYYEQKWFLTFFRVFEEFPSTPWLKIEKGLREKRSAECWSWEGPFLEVQPERLFNDAEEYPFFPSDRGFMSLTTVYAVEIDWTAADDAIKIGFSRWLASSRPKGTVHKKYGQVSPRELLKYLGALRLLRAFGNNWEAAQDHAVKHGKGSQWTPSYSDQRAWRRPRKNAQCMIDHGIVFTPAARVMRAISRSDLPRMEKARAKVHLAQLKRDEKRKITQLKDDEAVAEVLRQVKKGAQKQSG